MQRAGMRRSRFFFVQLFGGRLGGVGRWRRRFGPCIAGAVCLNPGTCAPTANRRAHPCTGGLAYPTIRGTPTSAGWHSCLLKHMLIPVSEGGPSPPAAATVGENLSDAVANMKSVAPVVAVGTQKAASRLVQQPRRRVGGMMQIVPGAPCETNPQSLMRGMLRIGRPHTRLAHESTDGLERRGRARRSPRDVRRLRVA